jgi:hypothetical protein
MSDLIVDLKTTLARRLAVIGTAGRQDDAARMTVALYDRMFESLVEMIGRWKIDAVVSGGAAWSDHLAVRAFLEGVVPNLVLFLPAEFDLAANAFVPNPKVQFNPGQTLNNYHKAFSRQIGLDTLGEISTALRRNSVVAAVHPGFHRRNSEVASFSNYLVAYTFGNHPSMELKPDHPAFVNSKAAGLKDGGTAHTFGECWNAEIKAHVNLFELQNELSASQAYNPRKPI